MTGERMFPFINKTWNPIAGGSSEEDGVIYACPYRCKYCWARGLINRMKGNLATKYSGPYRLHEPAMRTRFKDGDFVFVQDMSDIGAPGIPNSAIEAVFKKIAYYPAVKFLLLTKNPHFYLKWRPWIPLNSICGATIETDQHFRHISDAPPPWGRMAVMNSLPMALPHHERFICIEPIMSMSPDFERDLLKISPRAVAVGYDNYENRLPEPSLKRTRILIEELEANGVKVYEKTIRKAWDE